MLLPAVLKALARFAQLLSVEYFTDLLLTLKRIITSTAKDSLSLDTLLYTIQTVIQINQLQETAPSAKGTAVVDLKFYYDLLYSQLTRLPREIGVWNAEFEAMIEGCVVKLLLSKRHVPAERIAAFAHRFAAVSARMEDAKGAHYALKLICRLLERHDKARAVLDSEVLGVAAYRPECADPDTCNPFCMQLDIDALIKRIQQRHGQLPGDLQSYIRKIKKLSLD
jgi:nucleolar complex protein 3